MKFESLVVTFFLFVVMPIHSSAQTQSNPDSLTLTIKLQSAYNQGVKLCSPIRVNERLEFAWTKEVVRSSLSAVLSRSEAGDYHLKFAFKEGMLNYEREVKIEPKLELEKPHESKTERMSGFEISYSQTLLLSKEDCN